jgi:hypothetical protein
LWIVFKVNRKINFEPNHRERGELIFEEKRMKNLPSRLSGLGTYLSSLFIAKKGNEKCGDGGRGMVKIPCVPSQNNIIIFVPSVKHYGNCNNRRQLVGL